MRLSVVWLEPQRILKGCRSLCQPTLQGQKSAQASVCAGVGGGNLHSPPIACFCFVPVTPSLANRTKKTPGVYMVRIYLQDLPVELFRLSKLTRLMKPPGQ
jgi:hypothetical protein